MKKYIVSTNIGDVEIFADYVESGDDLDFYVKNIIIAVFKQWNYWRQIEGEVYFRCDECKKYPDLPQPTDTDFDWKNGRAHK